ncbi:thiamine/thiamine pyrophosphate ABC transporter permease ThiP [Marivivens donghaensis]|uniref:thiamine/thiamine pyrophosphate ABC transporter permease ThiP n=1 Tax=Marivivens donghaensis TaxID=1699413 RepID=UPI003F69B0F1
MARSTRSINYPRWPGAMVIALVLVLTLGTLLAVLWRAEGVGGLGLAEWAAVRFTVLQAILSAGASVVLAIPVARALSRRRFRGRSVLITLLGAPFILPVIVAVMGLLAVFGRNGLLNDAIALAGGDRVSIYGLGGVVLAHVFFNLPLAVRMILQGWIAIPAERFRLVVSLGASVSAMLERPMLRAVLPGAFMAIFLICLTSFAVALVLGGGPKATTVELAIYQAVRFDFDLGRAALLAAVQFGLSIIAALAAWFITVPEGFGAGLDRVLPRWDGASLWERSCDALAIALAAAFLILPLSMVVIKGVIGLSDLPASMWPAIARSVSVAAVSTALTIVAAVLLSMRGGRAVGLASALPLAASSLVVGTGLFVVVQPVFNPAKLALLVTALMNALMALPFALRVIAPAFERVEADYGRLADSIGLRGWARARIAVLPRIRKPLGFAAGLAAALSMGDLGVIALFATSDQQTLPLLMYQLMGSYRTDAASGAALVLLSLSLCAFWIFDRGGRADADA